MSLALLLAGTAFLAAPTHHASGATLTLGDYPNTTVQAGASTTVIPDAAPVGAARATAIASPGFQGSLAVDPATGVVAVMNAGPTGTHTVTVTAFSGGGMSAATSFTLTVSNPPFCTCLNFTSIANVSVGSGPIAMAFGDFNGDGKLDLATANTNVSNVSIKLGDGAGNFSGSTTVSVGSDPASIAVADINGDGKLDFATANATPHTVSIRLGDGAGNFSSTAEVSVGSEPFPLAFGDFNGDGKLDLAAGNFAGGDVSIRLGDGAGNFSGSTEVPIAEGSHMLTLVLADFNGDGNLDFATNNSLNNTIAIKFGDGAGNFSGSTEVSVGYNPGWIAVGDINGDGKVDFATANYFANSVSIRLGDGAGNFSGSTVSVGTPTRVAFGDFNGDGKLDLAVSSGGNNSVSIMLGDGAGNFSGPTTVSVGTFPQPLVVSDFNGDGKLDFAAANSNSNTISVRLNSCLTLAPHINVQGNNLTIAPGDNSPSTADGTDFGSTAVTGGMVTHTFTIQNTGSGPLNIFGITKGSDGRVPSFTLGPLTPASPIPPGSFATFTVTFDPSAAGLRTTSLNITSNDCSQSFYLFLIQGTGITNQNPVARCKNVTVSTDANSCFANASIDDGSSDPDVGDTITLTQSPAGPYHTGANTVTLTVTDNHGASSSCTATVTVLDQTPPQINCPASKTVPTDAGLCSALADPGQAMATDNCTSATVNGVRGDSQPLSAPYPKGTTTITWTATDGAGNSATCTQTITVEDHQAPAIACPTVAPVTANLGSTSAPVIYAAPGAGDNCAVASVACSPASGSVFAVGTTTVTCVATDTSGNTNACSFPVTVLSPQQSSNLLIGTIQALVNQGVLNQGQGNALIVKVQGAIQKMDQGNNNAARNQLQAFINDVNAMMSSGKLTAAQGQPLIDAANNLIAHIP
ncbi:MAG TPA: FG-GAP-like repeat-containing protein [Blastocatellia bacterium]|nr:FG-GAP-like repeat-containing protein [Blastocatellia bacterium]